MSGVNSVVSIEEKDWRLSVLPEHVSIEDVIRNLDISGIRIVLIVSRVGALIGTISDGDIRRGFLRGLNMGDPIGEIVNRNPVTVSPEVTRENVHGLMAEKGIMQVPVVDENRSVIGLHLWNKLEKAPVRSNPVIVMAGGVGRRMRPHTDNCPKPMLSVAGKPILEHIILRAREQGFRQFILAINYLGHMIEDYFGNGSGYGVEIEYLREKVPLGTAGAISLLSRRPTIPSIVTNGDVLTDASYVSVLDFHCRHKASATMAVRAYDWQHPFGVVQMDGSDIVGFDEKPVNRTYINAGIYVIEPNSIDHLVFNEKCDMPLLFERLRQSGHRTVAYPMHEPWLDVGRSTDLEAAQKLQ